jgi:hypothetical protein
MPAVRGVREGIGLQKGIAFDSSVPRDGKLSLAESEVVGLSYLFGVLLALSLLFGLVSRVGLGVLIGLRVDRGKRDKYTRRHQKRRKEGECNGSKTEFSMRRGKEKID